MVDAHGRLGRLLSIGNAASVPTWLRAQQEDSALNQPLSAFALAAIDELDPAAPTYALDVVSVIESMDRWIPA